MATAAGRRQGQQRLLFILRVSQGWCLCYLLKKHHMIRVSQIRVGHLAPQQTCAPASPFPKVKVSVKGSVFSLNSAAFTEASTCQASVDARSKHRRRKYIKIKCIQTGIVYDSLVNPWTEIVMLIFMLLLLYSSCFQDYLNRRARRVRERGRGDCRKSE